MDWLFQANPKRYDLIAALDAGVGEWWAMNQGRKEISPGDRVFFWNAGDDAALVAVGHVTSPVRESPDRIFGNYCVDVTYDYRVDPPFTRHEILARGDNLSDFKPFSLFRGTNLCLRDSAVIAALDAALADRLVPIRVNASLDEPLRIPQSDLDAAIKNAQLRARNALLEFINTMDPTAFEWLIRALLLRLGYRDVVVTKRSNDGGIDLRATLVAGGIANLRTAIQVKRTKRVGRPVVQQLRGSLSVHESGLLVTSGVIGDLAEDDATHKERQAIALVDGQQLVDLLIQHGIGVSEKRYSIYQPNTKELTLDHLQEIAEGAPGESQPAV